MARISSTEAAPVVLKASLRGSSPRTHHTVCSGLRRTVIYAIRSFNRKEKHIEI